MADLKPPGVTAGLSATAFTSIGGIARLSSGKVIPISYPHGLWGVAQVLEGEEFTDPVGREVSLFP